MKNRDVLEQQRETILQKMNEAIAGNDAEKFQESFQELCENIQERVLEEARGITAQQDTSILTARGVRQLTSEEKKYYEKVIDAMKSKIPQQALADLDLTFPETIIDSVMEDLSTNHLLLSKIAFMPTGIATRIMMNTNGYQKASWGALNTEIVKELVSGFKNVDMTLLKLTAFLPVNKDMLNLGPTWIDQYVRQVLYEALANGLEYGVVNGDGKDCPIGMVRQVGEGVTVTGGVYPEKVPIKITSFDAQSMGNLTSLMAVDENGKSRTVSQLILLVNPQDYYQRILPATTIMNPDGTYLNNVLPVPTEIIQCAAIPRGRAVFGMANRYFAGAGMGTQGRLEYSDEYRFLEDERVYTIRIYANGFPKDNNSFLVLDITELETVKYKVEMLTPKEASNNSALSDLRIGSLSLTPAFAKDTKTYTASTANATNTITVVPEDINSAITILAGSSIINNGSAYAWAEGENTVTITVDNGTSTSTYTVTVTKSV